MENIKTIVETVDYSEILENAERFLYGQREYLNDINDLLGQKPEKKQMARTFF